MTRTFVVTSCAVFAGAACFPPAHGSKGPTGDRITVADIADAAPPAPAPPPSSDEKAAPSKTQPLIRPVTWLCHDQDCEGAPRFAYDYLPAVSADGHHVAIVEERDGWAHTRMPGVRVSSTDSGASEAFFSVIVPGVDLTRDLRRKAEYESLVRTGNEGLAAFDFRPLFPATEETSESGRTILRVAGIQIEVSSPDQPRPEIVIRHGTVTKHVPTHDWDPGSGCSLRAFRFAGARPDVRVAVFVSEITMTGHNCDGVAERQPWAVRAVRW